MTETTIHIIDDHKAIRESLSVILLSYGYHTVSYSNGHDFIERYQASESECLILDVAMPEMNGNELFNYLKSENFQTAIIFLSGYADVPTAVKAIKEGAVDFIIKPFKPKELIFSTKEAIKKTHSLKLLQKEKLYFEKKLLRLTPKEEKIFFLMMEKKSINAMADILKRSTSTIEKHRISILKKLEFSSTSDIIKFCEKNGVDSNF